MSDSDDNVQLRVESPKLLEGVIALLQAPTDNDKRRVFESRPDLLSDAAVDLLEQIEEMHRNRGDEQSARSTAGLGDIVKAAIAHGVDFGMLQQVVFEAVSKAPDDPSDVAAYFETVPDRFPELLQPLAIDVLKCAGRSGRFRFLLSTDSKGNRSLSSGGSSRSRGRSASPPSCWSATFWTSTIAARG